MIDPTQPCPVLTRTAPANVVRHLPAGTKRPAPEGPCAVCPAPATRWFASSRMCEAHYRHAAKIHGYGVPNPIGVLKDLLDGLRREAMAPPAPAEVVASPIVEAIPVAEPPAKTVVTEPRRTLVERLKARREAAGRDA
jgi:hypothetical protein